MKNINYEETEALVSKKLKKLETDIKYELPEEYHETKKERKAGKVIYAVLSAAALFGVTFGIWYAAQYAKNYTPPGPKPASAYTVTNFPYYEPELTDAERDDIEKLLNSIGDEMMQSDHYTAESYEKTHKTEIKTLIEYDTKILRSMGQIYNAKTPSNNERSRMLGIVYSDICKQIIKNHGEESALRAYVYGKYDKDRDIYNSYPGISSFEDMYAQLTVYELSNMIDDWIYDTGMKYESEIAETELKNKTNERHTQFRWDYLVKTDENETVLVTFYPRQIYGEKYPICLMFTDAYSGTKKSGEDLSLPLSWSDILGIETEEPIDFSAFDYDSVDRIVLTAYKSGVTVEYDKSSKWFGQIIEGTKEIRVRQRTDDLTVDADSAVFAVILYSGDTVAVDYGIGYVNNVLIDEPGPYMEGVQYHIYEIDYFGAKPAIFLTVTSAILDSRKVNNE